MKKILLVMTVATAILFGPRSSFGTTDTEIYRVIRVSQPAALDRLLSDGVPPNHQDSSGDTLLMRAALYGQADVVRLLIKRGADVNATNKAGATALMRAAGNRAILKLLVENGANVNARSALGNTPLILAARTYPSADAVKLLIAHGAEVNITNQFGANAIMTAAAGGDLRSVRLLLQHGADVNSHSRGSEASVLWGGGRSPLMWAAARGDSAMIKLLLDAGANINEPEGFGTALIQSAWMDRTDTARLLIKRGADVNAREMNSQYSALHWAASSEKNNSTLVDLLLKNGADPNAEGGQDVDAFLGVTQTPLMLARKRGDTAITRTLTAAGARANPTSEKSLPRAQRTFAEGIRSEDLRLALQNSIAPMEKSAVESKKAYLNHASKQNCASCHQQYLPMTATAFAHRAGATLNQADADELLSIVKSDNAGLQELTSETTFHPEPGHSYGYALFALASQNQPADEGIDAIVHHLLVIQGKDGQWFNNLPRPPMQTSDVAPTALAIKSLVTYGFPARQKEIDERINRARHWLLKVRPANTEERVFQLLGLTWSGENSRTLAKLSRQLLKEQRPDGGWAQLPALGSDAYATGQALFALQLAGTIAKNPAYERGLEYLLKNQLDDGTWAVARRAFPFQPTMKSGFPHSRDSWISCSATSWAAMAIAGALNEKPFHVSLTR